MVELLRKAGSSTFRELMLGTKDRSELVARFLGLLELYRMGSASFSQPEAFEDFTVVWVDDAFDMDQLARLGSEFDD
jgi:segregation and condensation protein A